MRVLRILLLRVVCVGDETAARYVTRAAERNYEPARAKPRKAERYFTIVKVNDLGAERIPAELVAVITSL